MKLYHCLLGLGLVTSLALPIGAQDPDTDAAANEAEPAAADTEAALMDAAAAAAEPDAEPASAAEAPIEPVPAVCELHVFPTLDGQAQTTGWLTGFGIIGAVADAAAHEDDNISDAQYLREALGPRFQVNSFQSIDVAGALKLPEGTAVFYETPIADRDITTKVKTRLTESSHDCYAELVVTQNLYQKKAIYGRSLNNRFIYKDFRNVTKEAEMVRGRGGNGLSMFPPETPEGRDAADADLRQAFLANFNEYAATLK